MTTLKDLAAAYGNDGTDYMPHELGYGADDDLSGIKVTPGDTDDTVTVVLDYQIDLSWHIDLETSGEPLHEKLFEEPGATLQDDWTDEYFTDDDAWREWMRVVGNVISERYQGECLDMVGSVISFAEVRNAPADLPEEKLSEWIWENTSVVRLINETDPGTYNSGYLFNIISGALEGRPYDIESI